VLDLHNGKADNGNKVWRFPLYVSETWLTCLLSRLP
jgi:hypothetical protein